jgi:uncharacterized membrane protein
MKTNLTLAALIIATFAFAYCTSTKSATDSVVKVNYDHNVKPVIETHCSPCHFPSKGGNKKAYDNYVNVKQDIDNILRRVESNPGTRGFMPFGKAHKLNENTIAVFKLWKADGMN